MKITNISTGTVSISDLRLHKGSIGCVIIPGQTLEVYDDDAEKSVGLAALVAAGGIVTLTEDPRGSKEVLDDRLSVALNADGTLKAALRVDVKDDATPTPHTVTDPSILLFSGIPVSEPTPGTAKVDLTGFATDEMIKTDAADPTAGYLNAKIDTGNFTVNVTSHKLELSTAAAAVITAGACDVDANLSTAAQAVVTAGACDVDANLSTAAQAVVTAGACDVDANLSTAAQAAITASHGVNDVNTSSEAAGAVSGHSALKFGVHGISADGTVGQFLQTNGAGVYSFATAAYAEKTVDIAISESDLLAMNGATGGDKLLLAGVSSVVIVPTMVQIFADYSGAEFTAGDDLVLSLGTVAAGTVIANIDKTAFIPGTNADSQCIGLVADLFGTSSTSKGNIITSLDNTALYINVKSGGTQFTDPGTAAGSFKIRVYYREVSLLS